MTMEFLYLFSLLLYGDTLAKFIHFSMGILTILAIYSFSVKHFNKKIALLASLIFYNIPFVGLLSGWTFNDLMLTLYEFLAVAALLNWFLSKPVEVVHGRQSLPPKQSWLYVSAIFCGLSIGTKYTALLFLLPILLLAIAIKEFGEKKSPVSPLKKIALFLFIGLLAASPWLIKNAFFTHNPVYPFFHNFFYKFFGHPFSETFNPERFIKHHQPQNPGIGHTLSLLWRINMDKKIGPVFILLLPCLLLIRSVKPVVKLFLIYGGIYFLLWAFFTHQDTRFLIPCLPVLSIASAYAVGNCRGKHLTLFLYLVILFVFLFNLAWLPLTIAKYDLLKVATGIKNRDEFLIDSPFYQYPAFHYINNELPEDAKVLFVGENQTYYCNREIVSNSPLDTNIIVKMVNESRSSKEICDKLHTLGITHILFNASEAKRVARHYHSFNWASERASEMFAELLTSEKYIKEIFFEKGVFIYEVCPHLSLPPAS
jgi:4-amino-4-deoxy-L-arabinose transferase-like glycosyltransferase